MVQMCRWKGQDLLPAFDCSKRSVVLLNDVVQKCQANKCESAPWEWKAMGWRHCFQEPGCHAELWVDFFKHWSRLILSLWLTRSRLYKYQNENSTSSLRSTWYHEPKDLLARWFHFLFILTVFHLDFLLADAGQNCSKSEAAIHQWCCRRLRH